MSGRTATFSLLPSVKREWVAALRSGKYPQGVEALFDGKGYCCLGVLCKILGVKKFINKSDAYESPSFPSDVGLFKEMVATDKENKNKKQYSNEEYTWAVKYHGRLTPLSVLNDNERLTFNEIADIIEKQVPTHR